MGPVDRRDLSPDDRIAALETEIESGEPEARRRLLRDALARADQLAAQLTDLRGARDELQLAASERDAIATLLSDRSDAGTYAKVEGLLAEVEALRGASAALQQQEDDLRKLFWLNHHCQTSAIYGDDGEMQCNASHPNGAQHAIGPLDFKRDDLHRLASAICSMLRYEHQRAELTASDLTRLRSRGQALQQLLEEAIAEDDAGPNAEYCWWCGADINGKNGPAVPHEATCWGMRAKAACADALAAALRPDAPTPETEPDLQ